MTALAMPLVANGTLSLDDPASKWLGDRPWFSKLPNAKEIRVRHLLSHSAGIGDCSGRSYYELLDERILTPLELDEIEPAVKSILPNITPGYTGGARLLRDAHFRSPVGILSRGPAMTSSRLLELDGIGNVLLGLPLLLFPRLVSEFLGLPAMGSSLYPTILGGVFVGIGVALLVQRFHPSLGGLGLGGAISINLIFGLVLGFWLLLSDVDLTLRGVAVLGMLALILVGISAFEAISLSRRDPAQ